MTAIRGTEFFMSSVMEWIRVGDNDRIQGWGGVFQQEHLRYAVMTGRLNVTSIRTIVSHGCDPSNALDFCISPRMVRILVGLGGNPSTLSFFKDYMLFVNSDNEVCLHESGEESFREFRKIVLTFQERIVQGGVFPEAVAEWFSSCSSWCPDISVGGCNSKYILFKSDYMRAVMDRRGVYSHYKMVREFARHTKFLPVKVFFKRHFESVSRRVCGVESDVPTGISIRQGVKNPRVANLAFWLQSIVELENKDITRMVLSFL